MKLDYSKQLTLSVVIVLLANILSSIFKHWVFRSAGFVIGGLIWIIHPVMMNDKAPTPKEKTLIRIAGLILILIGVFTRVYIY